MITLLPNNIQKSKKFIVCIYICFLRLNWCQAKLFLLQRRSWCINDAFLPSGGQKAVSSSLYGSVSNLSFLLYFSPSFPTLYLSNRKLGKKSNLMIELLTHVPPSPFLSRELVVVQMMFCCRCSTCQESFTIPDWVCFTHQGEHEGRGEPEALPRTQSRLFQTVLWSPQRAPTALWAQLVELRKVHPEARSPLKEKKETAENKVFDFNFNSWRYLLRTRCLFQVTWESPLNLSQIYCVDNKEKPVTVCDLKPRPQNPQEDLASTMSVSRADCLLLVWGDITQVLCRNHRSSLLRWHIFIKVSVERGNHTISSSLLHFF